MIKLDGIDVLLNDIDNLVDSSVIESALGKACAIVEASAKQKAPKDTGALRRSIQSRVENNQGIIFSPLDYAPYIEYGTGLFAENGGRKTGWVYEDDEGESHFTRGQHPQPYMRPALDENREKIIEIVKESILDGKSS